MPANLYALLLVASMPDGSYHALEVKEFDFLPTCETARDGRTLLFDHFNPNDAHSAYVCIKKLPEKEQ
tara:strand:+ start:2222 stop:2425 length:204 start_codon:yes stop_codon:yes gene_type:complete